MSLKAKSKRTRARLVLIETNAVQAVIDALYAGTISIYAAEKIAANPPELQAKLLALAPKAKNKPPDEKTVVFPGSEERLARTEYLQDYAATSDQEIKAGKYFSSSQRIFLRFWRKFVKEQRRTTGKSHMQLWEECEEMVGRASTEFPDDEAKELEAFCKEHGI